MKAEQRILNVLRDYPLDGCGGYAISRLARVRSGRMYPILARLETEGVVESWWGSEVRPRRRRYRLKEAFDHAHCWRCQHCGRPMCPDCAVGHGEACSPESSPACWGLEAP